MSISLAFFRDPGLTAPASSLAVAQAADGSSGAIDRVVYLGSPVVGRKFEQAAAPGTGLISVIIADASSGSGVEASHVKLATSASGLDAATPGAALNLGATLLSGVAHAVPVHVRINTPALASGVYADVTLATTETIESTV